MKSTYKLLGVLWDGLPEVFPNILDTTAAENLGANNISFKSLLQAQNEDDIEKILKDCDNSNNLIINIDCGFLSKNVIQKSFIEKRLNQMVYYLSRRFNNVSIQYVENIE